MEAARGRRRLGCSAVDLETHATREQVADSRSCSAATRARRRARRWTRMACHLDGATVVVACTMRTSAAARTSYKRERTRARRRRARRREDALDRNVVARSLAIRPKIWQRGGQKGACGKMQKKDVFMAGCSPTELNRRESCVLPQNLARVPPVKMFSHKRERKSVSLFTRPNH